MTTMKLLTAAAIATSLMATPVLAKDQTKHRAKAQADYSAQMNDDGYGDGAYQNGMRTSDSGFWPGDVATGVVGGAVGVAGAAVNTAGNIATVPFRGWDNSYAYYNGPTDRYDSRDSYARRNNFVCQPGTWFRGEDGQRHICQ